jgi:hypothetical protein
MYLQNHNIRKMKEYIMIGIEVESFQSTSNTKNNITDIINAI